jgi:hypothetical protein
LRAACYLRKRDAKEQDLSLDEDPKKIHRKNLQKSKPNHNNNNNPWHVIVFSGARNQMLLE